MSHKDFETELSNSGFELISLEKEWCDHSENNLYYFYIQLCSCCSKNKNNLPWYKMVNCFDCTEDYLECLFCGGHYSNFRIWKVVNGIEEKCNEYDFAELPLGILPNLHY